MEKNIFSIFDDEQFTNETNDEFSSEQNYEDEKDKTEMLGEIHVCKECDYRWEYNHFTNEDSSYNSNTENYCPMCGSSNTLQIQ